MPSLFFARRPVRARILIGPMFYCSHLLEEPVQPGLLPLAILVADQACLHCPDGGGGSISGVQFSQNVLDVLFDRLNTDVQ